MIELEEIIIEDEELELIQKNRFGRADFPAANVLDNTIYFNVLAFGYVPEFIEWRTSTEYVVGIPTTEKNSNAYHFNKTKRGFGIARLPVVLKNEKKLQPGIRKLFRYKDGFCFKRYEIEK